MKPVLTGRWAETPSPQRREPTALEIANGFPCGAWDLPLFNELEYRSADAQRELGNLVTGAGLTLSESDPNQALRAVRRQSLNFVAAANVAGTANAVTLAFSPAFAALADLGGTPLVFHAKFANTGAVTIGVDAFTAKALVWPDNTALVAGDVLLNETVVCRYNSLYDAYVLFDSLSPAQVRALINVRTTAYAVLAHTEVSGTNAGAAPANNTWFTRKTNSIIYNPGSIVTLASNQFTLGPGRFLIRADIGGFACNRHYARLYNVTDAAIVAGGTAGNSLGSAAADPVQTHSIINAEIVTATSKTFRIEQIVDDGTAFNYGLGFGAGLTPQEIYTNIFIQKVAD